MTINKSMGLIVGQAPSGTRQGSQLGDQRSIELSRRSFVATAGKSALAIAGSGALASCSTAASAAKTVVFNPAVDDWLGKLASSVAATVAANALTKGLSDFFSSWTSNVNKTVNNHTATPPYTYVYNNCWVHTVPPVVLVGITQESTDPLTDKMLACVNAGQDAVLFEPWAWQALSMFTNELTSGKTGADLAGFQSLCVLSLIPSGTAPNSGASPEGSVAWMTYETRNGNVEISQQKQPDGSYSATVTADGIPDADHSPTSKHYTLPTQIGTESS